jgi:hypothetical protein
VFPQNTVEIDSTIVEKAIAIVAKALRFRSFSLNFLYQTPAYEEIVHSDVDFALFLPWLQRAAR